MNMVMTSVTNRGLGRAELKRRIEAAALDLFAAEGFDAVSVDRIVARARVSKGAFFVFFPSKPDVLAAAGAAISNELARAAEAIDPSRPLAALAAFAEASQAILAARHPIAEALCRHLAGKGSERLAQEACGLLVERLQATGGVDPDLDPGAAGRALSDLWFGAALVWLCGDGTRDFAEDLTPRLRLAFTGLAA